MKANMLYFTLLCVGLMSNSFAQNDDWQWAKRGGGTVGLVTGSNVFSTGVERVLDLAIDSNDNYYFLAEVSAAQTDYDGSLIQTYSQDDNRKDIFMFSTDCQGNFRWSKSIGGGFDDRVNSIGVDSNNNIYISGSTLNMGVSPPPNFANDTIKSSPLLDGSLEESRKSMFIIKYDEQGNFQWLREPEGPVDYFGAQVQKTIIEDNGRSHSLVRFGPGTHLEGQLTLTNPLGTSAIVIYNTNGDVEDFFEINMQPGFGWYDYQLAYDPNLDRYYLADTIRGSSSNVISINGFGVNSDNGFYLAALDNQGQVLWYHESTRTNSWTLGDIALDDNGDIYFTGEYNEGLNNEVDSFAGYTFQADPTETAPKSPFLIKLDSSGNLIWGTNATQDSRFPGRSIAIKGNDVYLGLGSLNNEWDGVAFGTAVSGVGLLATDNTVLRFNKTTGGLQEVISMPSQSTAFDMIMAMDIDGQGNIVVGGHFGGTLLANHPAGPITKVGGDTDFFVAQYGQDCSLGVNENANNFSIKLYPQPASGVVNLQSQRDLSRYEIYNLQGKSLQQGQVQQNQIDISRLSSGLYIIKIISDDKRTQVLKMVVE